jgi:RNA polymerase sigma-70 factor (ECF subfamily)
MRVCAPRYRSLIRVFQENRENNARIFVRNLVRKTFILQHMDARPDKTDAMTEVYLRLMTQHDRWLAAYVYSLVPRAADVDDILQEVKVTMWKHFAKFDAGSNFRAWARQIATHQVLNFRRAEHRRPSATLDDSFVEAVAAEIDRRADEFDQRAEALRNCLKKLADGHRKIIVWRYFDDCGIEAIAARTQRSTEAVYQLLSRIRGMLNECVSRQIVAQL